MIDGTNSRVEQELTGAGYSAPISRLERIIDGEDIKPLSRIEDKMKQYIAGGGGGKESSLCSNDISKTRGTGEGCVLSECGKPRVVTVYDANEWLACSCGTDSPQGIDPETGKWKFNPTGNYRATCMYNLAIDPNIVRGVYCKFIQDIENSYGKTERNTDRQICLALFREKTAYDGWLPNSQQCALSDWTYKNYENPGSTPSLKQEVNIELNWDLITDEDFYKYKYYVAVTVVGSIMVFDTVNFLLKEV